MKKLNKWAPALWIGLGAFQIILVLTTGNNKAFGVVLGVFMLILGVAIYASQKRASG